jgi:hypothetical protein
MLLYMGDDYPENISTWQYYLSTTADQNQFMSALGFKKGKHFSLLNVECFF